ncbi:MAG: nucleoside-diphosphate kinase [Dehalococcoidia bacterium]|nr:MAG: nucleoside-diphosphate kinase [Dehalococcoidia bacterium]
MERTLVLIKPDAMQRGLAFPILQRFEQRGLKIVALRLVQADQAIASEHYAEHVGKPFYPGLIEYITACPIIAAVFEGTGAVAACRQTMGSTKPVEANPGTIRHDFGLEIGRNLVHGSANLDDAAREVGIWFRGLPVLDWKRATDGWVFEQ